jgi:hypothetical protein
MAQQRQQCTRLVPTTPQPKMVLLLMKPELNVLWLHLPLPTAYASVRAFSMPQMPMNKTRTL